MFSHVVYTCFFTRPECSNSQSKIALVLVEKPTLEKQTGAQRTIHICIGSRTDAVAKRRNESVSARTRGNSCKPIRTLVRTLRFSSDAFLNLSWFWNEITQNFDWIRQKSFYSRHFVRNRSTACKVIINKSRTHFSFCMVRLSLSNKSVLVSQSLA